MGARTRHPNSGLTATMYLHAGEASVALPVVHAAVAQRYPPSSQRGVGSKISARANVGNRVFNKLRTLDLVFRNVFRHIRVLFRATPK